jgi:sugar phosphate isomerase/epimerase
MYRIGLSGCSKEPTDELFASYIKNGIELMEISRSSIDDYEKIDFELYRTLADKHGVELWSFHLPFCPFGKIDISKPELALFSVEYLKEAMNKASKIGIKRFVIHASGEPIGDTERPERMKTAKESLAILAEHALSLGAVIAVENLPRTCLGRSSDDIAELISAHEALRVCFDTNHLLGEEFERFIDTLGDKIITTHISDYDFVNERHWLPGEGKLDWQALIKALKAVNYDGPWLYEIDFHCPCTIIRERNLTCEDFARNAKEVLGGEKITVISKPKPNLGYWD